MGSTAGLAPAQQIIRFCLLSLPASCCDTLRHRQQRSRGVAALKSLQKSLSELSLPEHLKVSPDCSTTPVTGADAAACPCRG